MAGDWIKMRVDLGDDPAVIGIASYLNLEEDMVVGKLHRLWSWADKHTIDGTTNGVTLKWVDRFVAHQGFADALCKFNWLAVDGERLIFPNFDRHNGSSAKSRAEATIRQRLSRKNRDDGVTGLTRVTTPAPFIRVVHDRDGHHCAYCGYIPEGKEKLGVDHIIPLTRGGKDAIENLVSCCKLCNNEKNDRTPEEFGLLPTFLPDGVEYVSQQICDKRVTKSLPEKRREEKNKEHIRANRADVFPEIENRKLVNDWLAIRKLKKLAVTETAIKGFISEVEKSGFTIEKALTKCCHEGWGGFKASWITAEKSEPKKAWE